MLQSIRPKYRTVFAYLCIPLAVYVFAVFIPFATAFYYSFFDWRGGPNKDFSGIKNYAALINDSVFWQSFVHNIYLVALSIAGQIGIAFILVLFINSKLVKLKGIHRTFGFFPSTISAVSIGLLWKVIYDYRYGLINWFLGLIGSPAADTVWLNEPDKVMFLVSIPIIWQYIGYYMVILLAGISAINPEIFEVAEIDGANGFQRAIYIVLPLIKNTLLVCVTLCIAGNMRAFDHIFVMTSGGPGTSSMVMAIYGYTVSFVQQNMGYGSTISIGICVASLVVILGSQQLITWLGRDKEADA